ncbi:hypothetical protein EXU48_03065 [Occultella glacieicola]|uniref:Uncharacterized protein n=1 Tax=Occultella glacieicola TaxID=2518684 RepID=A0ABY2EBL5_9MICO|nr:hypothetical protein [Occultella glacieicola]TDE97209.1 hypothetical protein EXU48_03065 [Occultella glacieicola]
MRRSVLGGVLAVTASLGLAACGGVGGPPGGGPPPSTGGPGELLVGAGTIMQLEGEPAQICLGAVLTSYPPQCAGPELVGFEGWDGIEHESASGRTWGNAWVVGTYDGTSFTLTEPVSVEPPTGWEPSTDEPSEFPQLCDDPAAGAGGSLAGTDLISQQSDLMMFLEAHDGYVLSYVSGGGDVMNVLVSGDAASARVDFREIYAGPLCVQTSELPTWAEIRAAQDALTAEGEDLGVLSSGSGVSGLLDIHLVVADSAHVSAVAEIVAPWLRPDEIAVTGALAPLVG